MIVEDNKKLSELLSFILSKYIYQPHNFRYKAEFIYPRIIEAAKLIDVFYMLFILYQNNIKQILNGVNIHSNGLKHS